MQMPVQQDSPLVSFRFKVPDLEDHFETFNSEQSLLALEGAMNIIFGGSNNVPQSMEELVKIPVLSCEIIGLNPEDIEMDQTQEELALEHETQITTNIVTAITTIAEANMANDVMDMMALNMDDIGDTPLYQANLDLFQQIVAKLSLEFNEDKFNQDIVTILGEMMFHSRIEVYSFTYDPMNSLLNLTVSFHR